MSQAEANPARVHLADVQRLLTLFTQGLLGRYLHLKPRGSLTGDFRPEGATTDGQTIYLPASVASFESHLHNLGVYRISVLHQLGYYENGTFEFSMDTARKAVPMLPAERPGDDEQPTGLQRFFALWSSPLAMRRMFMTLEDLRIDAAMPRRYPGARDDLGRVLARALSARPALAPTLDTSGPQAMLFEGLVQFSLGAAGEALVTEDGTGLLAAMLAAAMPLRAAKATVYDTARAAVLCYRLMAQAAAPGEAAAADPQAPPADPRGPAQAGGEPGDDPGAAADDDQASMDDAFEGLPIDFRGEVRPDLVQRRLRAGHTGSLLDTLPADHVDRADADQADREQLERELRADRALLRRAFGDTDGARRSFLYDEWNYHGQSYLKGWCRLFEHRLRGEDFGFITEVRQRHADLAHRVKRQFKHIKPESYQRVRRVSDGEELELDGIIEAVIDRRAGHATDEHVYRRRDRGLREVSAVFLLDMSASTSSTIPDRAAPPPNAAAPDAGFAYAHWYDPADAGPGLPKRRMIDVAKESLALMADALETLGDSYAIYGFSGEGRDNVEFYLAKEFDDRLSPRTWAALAAIKPRRSTRMGPAIRHCLTKLERQVARMKVLIVVSDGYPQDIDYGPDRGDDEYGIQDTARALEEAVRQGVQTFCVTIDPDGNDYLRRMCAAERYMVIDEVTDLPGALTKVYRALTA